MLCARCRRRILPGTPFDLDHTPDRSSYLGASHRRCNRVEGGQNGAAVTNRSRRSGGDYGRYWSRVWGWPIPPDVYVDPDVVRAYVEEEASSGTSLDPAEVRAYFAREGMAGSAI